MRQILAARGITFQRTRTWKESHDPDLETKLDRIEEVVTRFWDRCFAFDQFGPLSIRYEAPPTRLKDNDGSALVLEVANRGGRPAEDVRLDLSIAESTDAGPPVHRFADITPFTMAPQDVRSFRLYPTQGMSRRWTVTARWTEDTREFSSVHSVTNPL